MRSIVGKAISNEVHQPYKKTNQNDKLIKDIYGHSYNEKEELGSWHAKKRKIFQEEKENSINYARKLIN